MKAKNYTIALFIGVAIGILTALGQKFLPDSVNNFANSGAVWLVPAFLVSYIGKYDCPASVLSSVITLLGCVIGYYGFEPVMNGHAFYLNRWMLVWVVMSFVAGAIFGMGAYLSNNSEKLWKYFGMNLLPAVFITESLSKLIHFQEYAHLLTSMVLSIVIGIVLYFVINGRQCLKGKNLLSLAVLAALGTGMFELLYVMSI